MLVDSRLNQSNGSPLFDRTDGNLLLVPACIERYAGEEIAFLATACNQRSAGKSNSKLSALSPQRSTSCQGNHGDTEQNAR